MMEPLKRHLEGFPKTMDLDEKTALSIARMIAYVTVFSTHHSNASPEMSKEAIKLDAILVDEWLMGNENKSKCVSKHCSKCSN